MRTLSLKPFAVFGAAALLTLAAGMAFATTPARAAGLTSVQVQAILSLLSSFGADQSVINNVSAALGGQATAPSSSCVDLSQNLTLGSSGSDVTNLQNYLIVKGDLAAGYNTGYYGFLTAQAVGKLQLNLGILSSANDSAYGITGPQTRSAIGCGSTNPPTQPPVIPPSSSASLTATPASGAAPLAVQFSGRTHALADGSYSLQFGDGQEDDSPVNNPTTSDCIIHDNCIVSASHTYRQPGTYMVKLIGNPDMSAVPVTVSTATVTVTGQSTSAAPSISSLSSNSGLPGTQITINGRGLDAQGTVVYFDSQNNTAVQNFVSVGPSEITLTIPSIAPGNYDVRVVNVNGDSNFSNPQSFFVQPTGPTVNSVSPSSGINGSAQITIGGYGFGSSNTINFVQGNSKFQVANQIPSSYSGTTLTFSLSSSGIIPGVYGVQVCSGSNCSNTNAIFTLVSRTNGPYVASASINDGQSGWVLDVQGSGFTTSSTVSLIHNGQTTVLAQSVYGNPSSYQISTALPGDICTQANEDCQDGSFSVQVTNGNSASNTFQIVDTRG